MDGRGGAEAARRAATRWAAVAGGIRAGFGRPPATVAAESARGGRAAGDGGDEAGRGGLQLLKGKGGFVALLPLILGGGMAAGGLGMFDHRWRPPRRRLRKHIMEEDAIGALGLGEAARIETAREAVRVALGGGL